MPQLLDLLLLAPDIQEDVLLNVASSGQGQLTERQLRSTVEEPTWPAQ